MNLKDYLYLNRLSVTAFSDIIEFSRNHISGVINGRLKPSKKFIRAVERATNGEVKAEDLLKKDNE